MFTDTKQMGTGSEIMTERWPYIISIVCHETTWVAAYQAGVTS